MVHSDGTLYTLLFIKQKGRDGKLGADLVMKL
jgi:hypothetical protein